MPATAAPRTPVPVIVRPALHDDVPALHALVERSYRGRDGWTHEAHLFDGPRSDRASLAAVIDEPGQSILIAVAGDAVVASVQVGRAGNGAGYLGLLSVDPAFQSRGLGRTMVATAEAEVVARFGANRMELTVIERRPELIAWYVRLGYAATGETRALPADIGQVSNDFQLLVLEKPLAAGV